MFRSLSKNVLTVCTLAAAMTLAMTAGTPSALSAPIRVAVEDGTGHGGGGATAAQLNDDTFFDFSATMVSASQIDSLAELSFFDVVILGGTGHNDADWTPAMTGALHTWVLNGGGLIGTGWLNFDIRSGDPTAADLEFLLPTQNIPSVNEYATSGASLNIVNGTHPVTVGLGNFAPGANFIEVNRFAPELNDTVLATIVGSPGDISVAVKDSIGLGRSVYLGPLYLADPNYNTALLRSGDADQLLEQAVAWSANSSTPAVTPEPASMALLAAGALPLLTRLRRRVREPELATE
jgi:hypothetical protein